MGGICLRNKSILLLFLLPLSPPPPSLSLSPLCNFSLSEVGADRGAVSRCLCQKVHTEEESRKGNEQSSLCLCLLHPLIPSFLRCSFFFSSALHTPHKTPSQFFVSDSASPSPSLTKAPSSHFRSLQSPLVG